jgi:DNA sulfur modification protein DndB
MPYTFPAVKGEQNGTEYFLTTLEYGEVDSLVELPEEYFGKQLLNGDLPMQRELNWSRVRNQMREYLLNGDYPFYSALTLFIVPRDLEPLEPGEGYEFRPASSGSIDENKYGQLIVRSSCILFPGDGQHRAASIKEALRDDKSLASVQIPVVLIPFHSKERVRQMFADLNLWAKSPGKTIGLAFESRDPIALITKAVIKEVPLFDQRVNLRTNSLSKKSPHVITMNALFESNKLLLNALGEELDGLRSRQPGDEAVGAVAQRLEKVWSIIIECLPEWKDVMSGRTKPGELREDFVYAHGIGWQAIAHAAAALIRTYPDRWAQLLRRGLVAIDWHRANQDWQGVAMVGTRINNTGPGIRATAGYILKQAGVTGEDAEPYATALKNSLENFQPEQQDASVVQVG